MLGLIDAISQINFMQFYRVLRAKIA